MTPVQLPVQEGFSLGEHVPGFHLARALWPPPPTYSSPSQPFNIPIIVRLGRGSKNLYTPRIQARDACELFVYLVIKGSQMLFPAGIGTVKVHVLLQSLSPAALRAFTCQE